MAEKTGCILCGKKSFTCAECKVREGGMRIISIKEIQALENEISRLREANKALKA